MRVERMWETVITGYGPNISVGGIPISVSPTTLGLASARYSGITLQGGFTISTGGFININVSENENFTNWQGAGVNGRNSIAELVTHEVDHVLGVGTLWDRDYGEPFLSRFTVESMRDLGYTVARFEDFDGDGAVDLLDDQATSFMAGCPSVMPTTSSTKIFTARDCPYPVAGRSLRASCPSLTRMPPALRHPGCAWRHTPARGARAAPR